MAKKMKVADAAIARGIAPADLKRVMKDINRQKENASEYAGLAGQAMKQAVEQYGLDRKALAFVCALAKKEPEKQQGTLRSIVEYSTKAGMFDQMDAFDDMVPMLEDLLEKLKNRVQDKNAERLGDDKVMGDLVGHPVGSA